MTIREVIDAIQKHPAVLCSIPLEASMGFPAVTICNNRLCLHFLYYNTKLTEDKILLYEPRYSLKTVHPFNRIVKIEDLSYNPKHAFHAFLSPKGSIALTAAEGLMQREKAEVLFASVDQLLNSYEKDKLIAPEALEEYRLKLYQTVNAVHLPMYRNETE